MVGLLLFIKGSIEIMVMKILFLGYDSLLPYMSDSLFWGIIGR